MLDKNFLVIDEQKILTFQKEKFFSSINFYINDLLKTYIIWNAERQRKALK